MANTGYIPILIVAQNENDEYIHIKDANENENYFCPCCHQSVKVRARASKKVQPHFYHTAESPCSNSESLIHWTYKNWLFTEGSKFKIPELNKVYTVKKIEIEKVHNTKFGDYCPDITVYDTDENRFFFEINYSNKKKYAHYADRWCELDTPIVEINVKELINTTFDNDIPEFELLFMNGKYYGRLEKNNNTDAYFELQKRKQNVIDLKEHDLAYVNKLDMVWKYTQKFTKHEINQHDFFTLSSFKELSFEDQYFFAMIAKRIKCIDLEKSLANYVAQIYMNNVKEEITNCLQLSEDFEITIKENKSSKFIIYLTLYIKKDTTKICFSECKKIKKYANGLPIYNGEILSKDDKNVFDKCKQICECFFGGIDRLKEYDGKHINISFQLPEFVEINKDGRFYFGVKTSFFDKENDNIYINPILFESKIIWDDVINFTNDTEYAVSRISYVDKRYGLLKSLQKLQNSISCDQEIVWRIDNVNSYLRFIESKYDLGQCSLQFKLDEFTSYSVNISFTYNEFIISKVHFEDIEMDTTMFKTAIDTVFENFKKRFLYLAKNHVFEQFNTISFKLNNAGNSLWYSEVVFLPTKVYMAVKLNPDIIQSVLRDIEIGKQDTSPYYYEIAVKSMMSDKLSINIELISSNLFNFKNKHAVGNSFYYQSNENYSVPIVDWKQYVSDKLYGFIKQINTDECIPIRFIKTQKEIYK